MYVRTRSANDVTEIKKKKNVRTVAVSKDKDEIRRRRDKGLLTSSREKAVTAKGEAATRVNLRVSPALFLSVLLSSRATCYLSLSPVPSYDYRCKDARESSRILRANLTSRRVSARNFSPLPRIANGTFNTA